MRAGPGTRLPRLPALYVKKTKWRPPEQADPTASTVDQSSLETIWRRNYASLAELSEKVIDVLEDQSRRGQKVKLEEHEGRQLSTPGRCLAWGQQESKTPRCVHGACSVRWHERDRSKQRTRIRDQESAPVASDLKRAIRGTASPVNARSLSPPSDPHRTPGLAFAGLPSPSRRPSLYQQSRDLWRRFSVLLLVERRVSSRVSFRHVRHHLAPISCRRKSPRSQQP